MRWIVLCALTLLAGCGYQYGSDGPTYVRPEAASLDLDFLSLTEPCKPGPGETCSDSAADRAR